MSLLKARDAFHSVKSSNSACLCGVGGGISECFAILKKKLHVCHPSLRCRTILLARTTANYYLQK